MVAENDHVTDPKGPTGAVSTWTSYVSLDSVPQNVSERAKHLILDGLACALVGAKLPWSATAVRAILSMEHEGSAPVIGWQKQLSPPTAALLNGTFIQSFELDDYNFYVPLHSAALVVPAVLSAASQRGVLSGTDALTAAIAGYEIGPRVGLALGGLDMISRGWHSGAIFGTIAAAAAASRALGLSPAQVEDAIGLAATQSSGLMSAQYESMVKRMHHGISSRNGVFAAVLASHGFVGIKRVLEREYGGYFEMFSAHGAYDASLAMSELGDTWQLQNVAIKPYATMAGLHSPIDAVFALREQHEFSVEDIRRVEVEVGDAVYHHGAWKLDRPATATGAQMNLSYAVAVALLDGEVSPRQFTPSRIDSDDVWQVMELVEPMKRDDSGVAAENRLRTDVTIELRDGTRVTQRVDHARGGLTRPFSNDEIVLKYRNLVSTVIPEDRAARIEQLVLGLEELDDIRVLSHELSLPVGEMFNGNG